MTKIFTLIAVIFVITPVVANPELIGDLSQYTFTQPHKMHGSNHVRGTIGNVGYAINTGGPNYGMPYRRVNIWFKEIDIELIFDQADDIWDNHGAHYDKAHIYDQTTRYTCVPSKQTIALFTPYDPLFEAAYLIDEDKPEEAKQQFREVIIDFLMNTVHKYQDDINALLKKRGEATIHFKKNHDIDLARTMLRGQYLNDKQSPHYRHVKGLASVLVQHTNALNLKLSMRAKELYTLNRHLKSDLSSKDYYKQLFADAVPSYLQSTIDQLIEKNWLIENHRSMTWSEYFAKIDEKHRCFGQYQKYSYPSSQIAVWIEISKQVYPASSSSNANHAKSPAAYAAFKTKHPKKWRALQKEILLKVLQDEFGKDFETQSFFEFIR